MIRGRNNKYNLILKRKGAKSTALTRAKVQIITPISAGRAGR